MTLPSASIEQHEVDAIMSLYSINQDLRGPNLANSQVSLNSSLNATDDKFVVSLNFAEQSQASIPLQFTQVQDIQDKYIGPRLL